MKPRTLALLLLAALASSSAVGQIDCSAGAAAANKLVCSFPFSTGLLSNDEPLGSTGITNAKDLANREAAAFNSAVATQASQLPLASATAGAVVLFKGGVPQVFNSLGPILSDRAQLVGRHKLFLGFTASQFVFRDIDGIPLANLTFGYQRSAYNGSSLISTIYTTENSALNMRLDQFTGVATFGLSNRLDLSVVVPFERISISNVTSGVTNYLVDANTNLLAQPYSSPSSYTPGSATGVGDINFNVKTLLWTGEHAAFASNMNVRVPTGDDLNYLGSGAWGFGPSVVYSYLSKVSPHLKVGYQWNTTTELNQQQTNSTVSSSSAPIYAKQSLPGGVFYDAGADMALSKKITVAADLLGNQFANSPTLANSNLNLTVAGGVVAAGTSYQLATTTSANSTYTLSDLSAGVKFNPTHGLVFSANVLIQLNNNGLKARPTPLLGLSYKF